MVQVFAGLHIRSRAEYARSRGAVGIDLAVLTVTVVSYRILRLAGTDTVVVAVMPVTAAAAGGLRLEAAVGVISMRFSHDISSIRDRK